MQIIHSLLSLGSMSFGNGVLLSLVLEAVASAVRFTIVELKRLIFGYFSVFLESVGQPPQ